MNAEDYSAPIRAVYAACVDECMTALCRHFATKADGYDGSFAYQTAMLAKLGAVRRETADIIARHTYGVDSMVSEAVRTAMLRAVREVEPSLVDAVKAGVVDGTDVPISEGIQTALASYSRQAVEQLNLVNTVMLESCLNNYRALVSNTAAYEAQLNEAQATLNAQTGKVVTGVSSHQQAVREAVRQFARSGLTVFTDKAGHHWSPEAYAAMDIRTTVNNAARQAVLDRNEAYGNDLVSVPINATARPKCYPWQGKVISTANEARTVRDLHGESIRVYALSETSYGEPDGLWGINCHHQPRPFFDGLSVIRGEVIDKAESDALYALTQQQRQLERKVRNLKREAVMLNAAGDREGFAEAARKVKAAQARLKQHCEDNNLPLRSDRTQVLGYNRSVSGKARAAAQVPTDYRRNKDGTIFVTHDWKNREHAKVPNKLAPFAVLETVSGKHRQIDRTLYGADSVISRQIHSRAHQKYKNPDYKNGGAHAHDFVNGERIPYYDSTGLDGRELTALELMEHADIIDHR